MTLADTRQQALLRGMAAVQQQGLDELELNGNSNDPGARVLSYAMTVLGDSRKMVSTEGDFSALLEANNVPHRGVKTPTDLLRSTRAMLIVFAVDDGRPWAVHRLGAQTVAFDPRSGERVALSAELLLKPYD